MSRTPDNIKRGSLDTPDVNTGPATGTVKDMAYLSNYDSPLPDSLRHRQSRRRLPGFHCTVCWPFWYASVPPAAGVAPVTALTPICAGLTIACTRAFLSTVTGLVMSSGTL